MRIFLQAHQRNFLYSAYKTTIACSSQKSHQRSWWIVHTLPTKRPFHVPAQNPTNEVGGSFILSLQKGAGRSPVSNPTNAVGGSFILCLQKGLGAARF